MKRFERWPERRSEGREIKGNPGEIEGNPGILDVFKQAPLPMQLAHAAAEVLLTADSRRATGAGLSTDIARRKAVGEELLSISIPIYNTSMWNMYSHKSVHTHVYINITFIYKYMCRSIELLGVPRDGDHAQLHQVELCVLGLQPAALGGERGLSDCLQWPPGAVPH